MDKDDIRRIRESKKMVTGAEILRRQDAWSDRFDQILFDALRGKQPEPSKPERIDNVKPHEKKPEIVYRIIDRKSGEAVGSYSRAYCDEYDFESVERARTANCHGVFDDKRKYAIAKYRVIYELIDPDCDNGGEGVGDG